MNKLKVMKKVTKTPCYCCSNSLYGKAKPRKNCKECHGTGKYKEYIYYHIANGICFSGDTIK
jgi:hypothetical protein